MRSSGKRNASAEAIGSIIPRVLSRSGLTESLENSRILQVWESVVGPAIARHAQPEAVRGVKLTVTVDSSVWLAELRRYFSSAITDKLNKTLGRQAVRELVFRIGEVNQRHE